MSNPENATVRRTLRPRRTVAQLLSDLDAVLATGQSCSEVQTDPLGLPAFTRLKAAVGKAHTSLDAKQQAVLALLAAIKAIKIDFSDVRVCTRAYEVTVSTIAKGNAQIITKAGLTSGPVKPPQAALEKVSVVNWKPGKHPCEAIITWPAAPGATSYAIEVNVTPSNPTGPYTALLSGTGRRRTVKALTPGAQVLVRIAAQGSDGTQADWSDPILATTAS
jgi:hypothetical protein